LGKLILSKLLNETANEINVGIRINDQSHLMKTEEIKPAKMQQRDVIAFLIICLIYNNWIFIHNIYLQSEFSFSKSSSTSKWGSF